jgi:hypothetical protein
VVKKKKKIPTIICDPWSPVNIKKEDPYTESVISKVEKLYSNNCNKKNKKPNKIVIYKPYKVSVLFKLIKE